MPSRTERQTWQRERWQIHDFLKYLESVNCLLVPLTLRKREKPDFRLSLRSRGGGICQLIFDPQHSGPIEIGIECSEVIDQSEAKQLTWEETQIETEPVLLRGDGYVGDSIEEEFATLVSSCVQKKHELLVKGYRRFATNLLLLYYNNFRPPMRCGLAVSKVSKKLDSYWTKRSFEFDAVIVRANGELMIFKSDYAGLLTRPDRHL